MCGIVGIVSKEKISKKDLWSITKDAERRGVDSSGILFNSDKNIYLKRSNKSLTKLIKASNFNKTNFVIGHSRLITNSATENQPVKRKSIYVIHNGIIVNHDEIWAKINLEPNLKIDTESIAGIVQRCLISSKHSSKKLELKRIFKKLKEYSKGTIACAIMLPKLGKILLYSNNGSLHIGSKNDQLIFSSEQYILKKLSCKNISQIREEGEFISIPIIKKEPIVIEKNSSRLNLIPKLGSSISQEKLLIHKKHNLKRCAKCVLPETMPFITFDENNVCNYCRNYKIRNNPKPKKELQTLLRNYLNKQGENCIVPFSGGRDSSYALHLIVKELGLKPITYTYDWGMVTDLGRRNISRMSSILGVENIIVAANIETKRKNIKMNLEAWLKKPHLGMISLLTAGDKHFFQHIESVKKQTNIQLNIWGINPLEVTHFKSGFLGVQPDFEEKRVYSHGIFKQMNYQKLRFKQMIKNPRYFNSSLLDTLSGEYFRSFKKKTDYFHLYDYWKWDESEINKTLINDYEWELAPDTTTTWRIGDGTAAFYNYVYYNFAGFTEHDTFRSNQIREGDITRDEALQLIAKENEPRFPNIKWYLDAIGMNFEEVINVVNNIKPIFY